MDIILIPGMWLGASSWDEVAPALERAGRRAARVVHVDAVPLGDARVINDEPPAVEGEVPPGSGRSAPRRRSWRGRS